MLQEPITSQYDLHFRLFGFDVRIAWGFWIVAALLGWEWSKYVDSLPQMDSPGAAVLLIIWIAAMFLSILVHELGHSLAMRWFGVESRIVLYHFGGLAIPDTFTSWRGARMRQIGSREQIVIAAAGPVFQLVLGLAVWSIAVATNTALQENEMINGLFGTNFGATAEYPQSAALYGFMSAIVWTSFVWSVLNLAPVLPLDGGHITLHALYLSNNRDARRNAHIVSIVAAGLLGLWFLSSGRLGGIMFLLFAANNWQALQGDPRGL